MPNATGHPIGLIVRHDRPRIHSGTLDEAIRLINGNEEFAKRYATIRHNALSLVASNAAYKAWQQRWQHERDVLASVSGCVVTGPSGKGDWIEFGTSLCPNIPFRIFGEPGMASVTFDVGLDRLDETAQAEFVEAAEGLGLVRLPDGNVGTAPGRITPDTIRLTAAAALEMKGMVGHEWSGPARRKGP